jgi:uncharacterized protein (TIGR03382 family)
VRRVDDQDRDGDGILDVDDNCPETPNTVQDDRDGDQLGDACDSDLDGDGLYDDGLRIGGGGCAASGRGGAPVGAVALVLFALLVPRRRRGR